MCDVTRSYVWYNLNHTHIRTYTRTHIHTYTHTHIHTYTHTHIHTYTHAHIHAYTHTRIHTYTMIPRERPAGPEDGSSQGLSNFFALHSVVCPYV